jgi:prephenate dehydratase
MTDPTSSDPIRLIAFQGELGANSDLAARAVFPGVATLPCRTFGDAFAAIEEGPADRAMIPIENSVAGRVADVHQLLPRSGLFIVGEHFQRVRHQLLGPKGATLAGVKRAHSHVQALQQCRKFLRSHGIEAVVHADTAGAAAEIAQKADPTEAAIASSLAAEIYGLDTLAADIEDADHNTTRFLVLSRSADMPELGGEKCITSLVFRVRNVPAALYKVLGGFATNGVNLTKLESYMVDGRFVAAQFYADAEGHPEEKSMRLALEEMKFFTREMRVLGTYPASPFRSAGMAADGD